MNALKLYSRFILPHQRRISPARRSTPPQGSIHAQKTPNIGSVDQGIAQSFSVFVDTIILCTRTAFIILLSGIFQPGAERGGVALTQAALANEVGE